MSAFLRSFFVLSFLTLSCSTHPKPESGFQATSVEKGAPLEALGVRPGDVIQEINGVPMTSLNSAQKGLSEVGQKNSGQIKVLRNGKVVILKYQVK